MYNSIQEKLINKAADDFARAIDQQIMQDIEKEGCMKRGWVCAPFTAEKFEYYVLTDVSAWIHINATDEYKIFGREFWFKSPKDLTAFVLKWA